MSDEKLARREREDGVSIMEKLAFHRFIRGVKIKHISEKIGVNQQVMSGYERGKHTVPFFVVEGICSVLGFKLIILDRKGKKIYEN